MEYIKFLFNGWFKNYSILEVSKECYENSPAIETAGTTTGIKIKNNEHLKFLIAECISKGFKLVV